MSLSVFNHASLLITLGNRAGPSPIEPIALPNSPPYRNSSMEKQRLATASTEELKKQRQLLVTLTAVFFGLLLVLVVVNVFLKLKGWSTSTVIPAALVPIALIIALVNLKNLKDIQVEVNAREASSR